MYYCKVGLLQLLKQPKNIFLFLMVPVLFTTNACQSRGSEKTTSGIPVNKTNEPESTATVTDTVKHQKGPQVVYQPVGGTVGKKKIYLTFDDGPNNGTLNVYHAVMEEQVPLSFFVVGMHAFGWPEGKRILNLLKSTTGIEVCNHSYTHASNHYSSYYSQPQKVVADFQRSIDSVQFTSTVARMPGRNAWRIDSINSTDIKASRRAIDSLRQKTGVDIMGWDYEWTFDHHTFLPDMDSTRMFNTINTLLANNETKIPGHLVLLAHDQAFTTKERTDFLKAVLRSLKNNPNYELVLASKYPGVKAKQ